MTNIMIRLEWDIGNDEMENDWKPIHFKEYYDNECLRCELPTEMWMDLGLWIELCQMMDKEEYTPFWGEHLDRDIVEEVIFDYYSDTDSYCLKELTFEGVL